jgi:RimJ/RimL family protein N-acetyltransferase
LERLKEFLETDLVNLSQGLVSISRATTHDSAKVKEVYDRNAHLIEPYRLAPEEGAVLKVFNIFWQSHVCGQIVLQIKDNKGVISYWVDSQLSNRNIATNAVILLKEYAFDVLNLSHLEAYILPTNERSIRVIEKSGFYKTESVYKANTPANSSVLHLIYKTQPEAL